MAEIVISQIKIQRQVFRLKNFHSSEKASFLEPKTSFWFFP